jgi:hypothetical protein
MKVLSIGRYGEKAARLARVEALRKDEGSGEEAASAGSTFSGTCARSSRCT